MITSMRLRISSHSLVPFLWSAAGNEDRWVPCHLCPHRCVWDLKFSLVLVGRTECWDHPLLDQAHPTLKSLVSFEAFCVLNSAYWIKYCKVFRSEAKKKTSLVLLFDLASCLASTPWAKIAPCPNCNIFLAIGKSELNHYYQGSNLGC